MSKHVVVHYSRTGNTRAVAEEIAERVPDPTVLQIRPTRERSYPNWLVRSFLPRATVPIEPMRTDLSGARAVFLGTPKWTLSCPPVSEFVRRADLDGVPTGLFVTYGGFDERRYARSLVDRLRVHGADVRGTLLVQRDSAGDPEYADRIAMFRDAVIPDG